MGEGRSVFRALAGKPEGQRPLGRPRCRWDDNTKMGPKKTGADGAKWIRLRNTVMELRVQ